MKTAVRTRYGPPEVVRISEVDKPAPRRNELLVKVHATVATRMTAIASMGEDSRERGCGRETRPGLA